MDIRAGKIAEVSDRFVDVELYNPTQLIRNVVKTSSLDLDEREEEPQINIGTEVLVLIDDYGTAYAIASMSQGIAIAKNKTTIIRNETNKFFAVNTLISGDGGEVGGVADIYSSKIKLRNDTGELFDLVSQLCQAVADTTPTGGSSAGSANAQKATALAIKEKIDSFR
ncbi:MAG: hypothetical protein ABXS91_08675 [Sulfurimonas sp.]